MSFSAPGSPPVGGGKTALASTPAASRARWQSASRSRVTQPTQPGLIEMFAVRRDPQEDVLDAKYIFICRRKFAMPMARTTCPPATPSAQKGARFLLLHPEQSARFPYRKTKRRGAGCQSVARVDVAVRSHGELDRRPRPPRRRSCAGAKPRASDPPSSPPASPAPADPMPTPTTTLRESRSARRPRREVLLLNTLLKVATVEDHGPGVRPTSGRKSPSARRTTASVAPASSAPPTPALPGAG